MGIIQSIGKEVFGINPNFTSVLQGKVSKQEVDEGLDLIYRESKRMSHEHAEHTFYFVYYHGLGFIHPHSNQFCGLDSNGEII